MATFKEKVALFKAWTQKPLKMLHSLWFICLGISILLMLILLTGVLKQIVTKSQHDFYFEVNSQIINLLFTIMCLYQHPWLCYHLVLLYRWRQEKVSKLRKLYCKYGTEKPHERVHMMVVVILFQVSCFSQYFVCGLNWGYSASERPMKELGLGLLITIGSALAAALYNIFSPLGSKEADLGVVDVEAHYAPPAATGQI